MKLNKDCTVVLLQSDQNFYLCLGKVTARIILQIIFSISLTCPNRARTFNINKLIDFSYTFALTKLLELSNPSWHAMAKRK